MADRDRLAGSAVSRALALFLLIAAGYVIGAELSWHSFSAGLAFGFPPAGITVAALLLAPRRYWPVIIAAIVVSEAGVDLQHHLSLQVALGSAAANVAEPVTGALCVRWLCHGRLPDLATRRDLTGFIAGAVLLGPVAGSLLGATVSWLSSGGWWLGLALQWVAGDGIAVLVVGAPILLIPRRRQLLASRWLELTLLLAITVALSITAFRTGEPTAPIFLPLLAWAAFRLSDLGVVLAGTAFAAVANYMTAAGYGGLARIGHSPAESLVVTQAYIAVIVIVGWLLAQEVTSRMSAVQDLDTATAARERAEARELAASLGISLADMPSTSEVAAQVVGAVRAWVNASHGTLSVLSLDGQTFSLIASEGAGVEAFTPYRALGADAPGPRCVRDGVPVYVTDVAGSGGSGGAAASLGVYSMAALPLLTEAGPLGYLGVGWTEPHESSPVERELLQAAAETASRALERARLREAEHIQRTRIETLSELTRLLAAALTPEEIGAVVTDRVRSAVGEADALSLGLLSADGRRLDWVTIAGYPGAITDGVADTLLSVPTAVTDAARTGRPVIVRTASEYQQRYQYPGRDALMEASHGASWLAWPLSAGPAVIGAISIMWRKPQQFGPGRLAFVAAVAELIAQALVRARLYADEHAITTVLQRAVMPRVTAVIPGLDIGSCYRQAGASRAIGGDWYDALALPGGRAYLAVGDVVGHGITAAEDMTQLRNAGRALAIAGHQPAELLSDLGRITTLVTRGQFATMAVVIAAPEEGTVTYATAGHPPILIRRAAAGQVEALPGASGPALGWDRSSSYTQRQAEFGPGDVLLLYTDGLIERRGEDLQAGIDRTARELQSWRCGWPLDDFCEQLIGLLAAQPQLDDMCALAVSCSGAPVPPPPGPKVAEAQLAVD